MTGAGRGGKSCSLRSAIASASPEPSAAAEGSRLYEGGKLLDDHIYSGPGLAWDVGLSRFGKGRHELVLEVDALREGDETFLEQWPPFDGEAQLARLDSVFLKGKLLSRIL